MDHHSPVDVDPRQLAASEALWRNFVKWSKWSVVAIAAGLIVMAAVFV